MNIPTAHIERIKALGYTEAEARFLYIVAVFSGYFTLGHFRSFTGSAYGKRSTHFELKLLRHAHATVRDDPQRGSIFHLFSRTIYGQIEKDSFRNRKKHSFDFVRTRLVLLDFVLANQELAYFETEQDKVHFFCKTMGVSQDFLPAKVYKGRSDCPPTSRYFVDKFPLFLAPPFSGAPPVVTLSYVDSGPHTPLEFRCPSRGLSEPLPATQSLPLPLHLGQDSLFPYGRRAVPLLGKTAARIRCVQRYPALLPVPQEVGKPQVHRPRGRGF